MYAYISELKYNKLDEEIKIKQKIILFKLKNIGEEFIILFSINPAITPIGLNKNLMLFNLLNKSLGINSLM